MLVKALKSILFDNKKSIPEANYLFRNIIADLTEKDLFNFVENAYKLHKNEYEVVYRHFIDKLKNMTKKDVSNYLEKIFSILEMKETYIQKVRIALFFQYCHEESLEIPTKYIITLISSKYRSIRKIGYKCITLTEIGIYLDYLIQNHEKYDDDIHDIIIRIPLTDKTIKIFEEELSEYKKMEEDDEMYFDALVQRNNVLIKLASQEINFINGLKDADKLSYIYICKSIKKDIDDKYLLDVYNSFTPPKYYLLKWYYDLGKYNVIIELLQKISAST